jgi:hypothetical protein
MANPFRGEVALGVEGEARTMRLSLAALCELEEMLGGGTVVALVERFEAGAVRAGDLVALLTAGLRGGGWPVSKDEVGALRIDGGPLAAARAAAELLRVTFAFPGEGADG